MEDTLEVRADHVLAGLDNSYNQSTAALDHVLFKGGCIYQHNVLRVNYTTYDINHSQDNLNPNGNHRDIMMLAEGYKDKSEVVPHRSVMLALSASIMRTSSTLTRGSRTIMPADLTSSMYDGLNWSHPMRMAAGWHLIC
jgi:hypothetical protein